MVSIFMVQIVKCGGEFYPKFTGATDRSRLRELEDFLYHYGAVLVLLGLIVHRFPLLGEDIFIINISGDELRGIQLERCVVLLNPLWISRLVGFMFLPFYDRCRASSGPPVAVVCNIVVV